MDILTWSLEQWCLLVDWPDGLRGMKLLMQLGRPKKRAD